MNQTNQEQSPVVTNSTSPVHVTAEKTDLPNNEAVTNLEGMTADQNGHWEMQADGIHSEAKDKETLSFILNPRARILSIQQM